MQKDFFKKERKWDILFLGGIGILVFFSIFVLNSQAPSLFPTYFIYVVLGALAYFLFSLIDFEVLVGFSPILFVGSIIFLLSPVVIGEITRGAVRWIPIGPITIQPSEIVRPFLIVFFAKFLAESPLSAKKFLFSLVLLSIPLMLIFIQPSLGVTILTLVSFMGVSMASGLAKKYVLLGTILLIVLSFLLGSLLAPYQRVRILAFINPMQDPWGAGYQSLQSMIAAGSGGLFGKGLGRGDQTQLAFLPERHTDFIFASISEELGFLGISLIIILLFLLLARLTTFMENAESRVARAFISGVFLSLLAQVTIHIGMNIGLLPITGVPLPLVSAGGSSFVATLIALSIAEGATRPNP